MLGAPMRPGPDGDELCLLTYLAPGLSLVWFEACACAGARARLAHAPGQGSQPFRSLEAPSDGSPISRGVSLPMFP